MSPHDPIPPGQPGLTRRVLLQAGTSALTLSAAAAAGTTVPATAPEIEISAESEITIACGGATITIKSSEVSVKAPLLSLTGAMVVLDGAQVKHNP